MITERKMFWLFIYLYIYQNCNLSKRWLLAGVVKTKTKTKTKDKAKHKTQNSKNK